VDGDQQTADPVDQPGRLARQVVVEPDEDLQLGQSLLTGVDAAQRVRESAGASVLALPGCRSARRRMVRPGR
jgi:hypothetical protein